MYCNDTVAAMRANPARQKPFFVKPFSKVDPKTRRRAPSSNQHTLLKQKIAKLETLIHEGSLEMRHIEDVSWAELEKRPWKSKDEAFRYLAQEKVKQNKVAETMRIATDQVVRQMLFQAGGSQGQIAYWESQWTRMRAAVMELQMQATTGVPVGSTVNERIAQHYTRGWAIVHTIMGTLHEMDNEQNSIDMITRLTADIQLKAADIRLRMAEDEGEPDLDLPEEGSSPKPPVSCHTTAAPAASKMGGTFLPELYTAPNQAPTDEAESVEFSMRGLFKNTRTTWSEEAQFISDCLKTHGGKKDLQNDPLPLRAENGMGLWMNPAVDREMYACAESDIMKKQGFSAGFAMLAQKLRAMEGYINNNAYTYNCAVALTAVTGVAMGLRYGYTDTKQKYQADLDRLLATEGKKNATEVEVLRTLEQDRIEYEAAKAEIDDSQAHITEMARLHTEPEAFFANHIATATNPAAMQALPGSIVCRLKPEIARVWGFNPDTVKCATTVAPALDPASNVSPGASQSRLFVSGGEGLTYAGTVGRDGGLQLPPLEARRELPSTSTVGGQDVTIDLNDPRLDGVYGQGTPASENDLIYPSIVHPDFNQFWAPSKPVPGDSPLTKISAQQRERQELYSAQQAANFVKSQVAPYPSVIHDMMLQQALSDPVIQGDAELADLTADTLKKGLEIVERRMAEEPADIAASVNALFAYIGGQRHLLGSAISRQTGYDQLMEINKTFTAIRLRYDTLGARVTEETLAKKAIAAELTTLRTDLTAWNMKQQAAPANVFDAFSSDVWSLFNVSSSTRMLYRAYIDNSFTSVGNLAQEMYDQEKSAGLSDMFRDWGTGATILLQLIQSMNVVWFIARRVVPLVALTIGRAFNSVRNCWAWQGIREQEMPTMTRVGRILGRFAVNTCAVIAMLFDTIALAGMMVGSLGGKWVPVFLGVTAVFANLMSVISAIGAITVAGGAMSFASAAGSLAVSTGSLVLSIFAMNPRKMDLMAYIGGQYAQCIIAIMNVSGPISYLTRAITCTTPYYDYMVGGTGVAGSYVTNLSNIFLKGSFGWSTVSILPLGFAFFGNRWREMVQDFGIAISRGTLRRAEDDVLREQRPRRVARGIPMELAVPPPEDYRDTSPRSSSSSSDGEDEFFGSAFMAAASSFSDESAPPVQDPRFQGETTWIARMPRDDLFGGSN